MKRRVVLLAFDGCQSLDVVGPYEAFATAAGYHVVLAGLRRGWIRAESGLGLHADVSFERLLRPSAPPIHTLVVAGGAGARHIAGDPRLSALVVRGARRARRVASVCTGAFVLARAGLLDGRRATTHWAPARTGGAVSGGEPGSRPHLRARRPVLDLGRRHRGHRSRPGDDRGDLGRDAATAVARELVVFVRRAGGQSQFSAQMAVATAERRPSATCRAGSSITPRPRWAAALARRAGMSLRNFARVFRAQVGVSPKAYVESVRLETARRLLEDTRLSIERVAESAGFGTPEALRRSMSRKLGVSPREYRLRFGVSPSPAQPGGPPS